LRSVIPLIIVLSRWCCWFPTWFLVPLLIFTCFLQNIPQVCYCTFILLYMYTQNRMEFYFTCFCKLFYTLKWHVKSDTINILFHQVGSLASQISHIFLWQLTFHIDIWSETLHADMY
jgi:hypothetical protein